MGKKGAKPFGEGKSKMTKDNDGEKYSEGQNLLGSPTFDDLGNGRFRCVQTGHELPAHSRDSYSLTKHCRLGLINSALSKNKPPLNMFRQDPQSCSKLICKLTGDIINKNEEHIWKHINGKRFLNMLDRKEVEQQAPNERVVDKHETGEKKGYRNKKRGKKPEAQDSVKKKKKQDKEVKEKGGVSEEDPDFWIPPVGDRWDNDDGGDRWGSDTEDEDSDEKEVEPDVDNHDSEVSKRKKHRSPETGGSSFPTRKKVKNKKTD